MRVKRSSAKAKRTDRAVREHGDAIAELRCAVAEILARLDKVEIVVAGAKDLEPPSR